MKSEGMLAVKIIEIDRQLQSTRGVPGGRVSGWGSQDQELDGNMKAQGLR